MTTTLAPSSSITPRLAAPANPARLIQLDILRGVAILLVIGRHHFMSPENSGFLWPLAGIWKRFGWTGVDLFFVLSGFLVGGLLCAEIRKKGSLDVKRFIIRRGLKIWPSYYLLLLFVFFVGLWDYPRFLAFHDIDAPLWPSLLHFQNYYRVLDIHNHWIPSLPREHLWSLAVEEHFYLVLPFLLLLLLFVGRSARALVTIPYIAIAVMITCTLLRCFTHNLKPFPWGTHVYPTHMRIDGLFMGVLLAYFYHFKPGFMPWVARHRYLIFTIGFLLVAPMALIKMEDNRWIPAVGFTMLYVGYGCILIAALATPADGLLSQTGWKRHAANVLRAVGWIGLFSYPIYLWHLDFASFPTQYLAEFLKNSPLQAFPALAWVVYTLIYVSLAIFTGVLLGKLVEKPMLLFRDRFFPRRAEALTVAAPRTNELPTYNHSPHLNGHSHTVDPVTQRTATKELLAP